MSILTIISHRNFYIKHDLIEKVKIMLKCFKFQRNINLDQWVLSEEVTQVQYGLFDIGPTIIAPQSLIFHI